MPRAVAPKRHGEDERRYDQQHDADGRLDLVRVRMPGDVLATSVDPAAVEAEEPLREVADPGGHECGRSDPAEDVRAQHAPQSHSYEGHEKAGKVGGDLVVEPRA